MAENPDPEPNDTAKAAPQDDVRRRFREALERKQAKGAETGRSPGAAGKGAGPASNEKRQRQFRRKSGG